MIHFITGGARSGKSRFAQEAALRFSSVPVYLATAKQNKRDEEFSDRIQRHQADRDGRWTTIEEPLQPSQHKLAGHTVVVDCVTLWLSNLFSLYKYDIDQCLQHLKTQMDVLKQTDARFFIVSNELGMGLHANSETGRKFTDLQGWANQYIAQLADEVIFMVSGLPLTIKPLAP